MKTGYTPLYTAVRFGKEEEEVEEIVELLMREGGSGFGARDCFGMGIRRSRGMEDFGGASGVLSISWLFCI